METVLINRAYFRVFVAFGPRILKSHNPCFRIVEMAMDDDDLTDNLERILLVSA